MLKTFALIWGVLFLAAGAGGFIPALSPPAAHPGLTMEHGSAMALGLFPVNTLHNIVHLLFGIWGVLAARSVGGSRTFAQAVALIYGLLIVLGLLPQTNNMFGLVPLHGNDVWLHVGLALPAFYFGFIHRERHADVR